LLVMWLTSLIGHADGHEDHDHVHATLPAVLRMASLQRSGDETGSAETR
jgi:hypothetical protein